jgi:hypothetical protein
MNSGITLTLPPSSFRYRVIPSQAPPEITLAATTQPMGVAAVAVPIPMDASRLGAAKNFCATRAELAS